MKEDPGADAGCFAAVPELGIVADSVCGVATVAALDVGPVPVLDAATVPECDVLAGAGFVGGGFARGPAWIPSTLTSPKRVRGKRSGPTRISALPRCKRVCGVDVGSSPPG